jgi:hypothetical protein
VKRRTKQGAEKRRKREVGRVDVKEEYMKLKMKEE